MIISLREALRDVPVVVECTWIDFCQYVARHAQDRAHNAYRDKTQAPSVVFARTYGGFTEEQIDPEGMHAIALDFDAIDYAHVNAFYDFARRYAGDTAQHLIYTTFSHGVTEHARMRAVYPLDMPCPKHAWGAYWEATTGDFAEAGFIADPVCNNFARCYFLPVCNAAAPEWARTPWVTYA
jgi:hypothetical protein